MALNSGALSQLLLVGAGGFVGSTLRYALGGAVHRIAPFSSFPWGTLVVNVSGCAAIGFFAGLIESRQVAGPELRLFLLVGLLGGFTTFSTFGYETLALIRDAEHLRAAASVLTHLAAGLAAVWLGYVVSTAV